MDASRRMQVVPGDGWLQVMTKERVVSSRPQVLANAEEVRTPGKGER